MELGDGIAIAGVCAIIVTAIMRFVGRGNSTNDIKELKRSVVYKDTCEAVHKGVSDRLDILGDDIKEIKELILRSK